MTWLCSVWKTVRGFVWCLYRDGHKFDKDGVCVYCGRPISTMGQG